jgi:hypothetical protein
MSLKDVINKIKIMLTEEVVQLTDVKTMDGIILSYDGELAVGTAINIVDETGANPAPDGEYILEDGTKLEVVGGLVEAIESMMEPIEVETPEENVPAEAPIEAPVSAACAPDKKKLSVEDLSAEIDLLKAENLAIKEILTQLAESFSKEAFKEEVKMSLVNSVEKPIERPILKNQKYNELNNIFKNMYKK